MTTILLRVMTITLFTVLLSSCSDNVEDEFQGYVDGDLTFLASPFSGVMESLNVQEGQSVDSQILLAQLELEPQQSQYKQAQFELTSRKKTLDNLSKGERETIVKGIEAEIAKAQSELKLAEVRLKRAQTLYEKKLSEKDTLDQATTDYNTKRDTLTQLNAKLQEAKLGSREDVILAQKALVDAATARVDELAWALNSKKLYAPQAGYVYDIFYRQGEFVPASTPVISMIIPANQYVVFFAPLKQLEQLKIDTPVSIDCEGCQTRYAAKIAYISPKVEYTPPLIFSRQHHDKYVYRLHAKLGDQDILNLHLGQPVYVKLK